MAYTKKSVSENTPNEEVAVTNNATHEKAPVKVDIDLNQYITVRNGFNGRLVYKSKRTGEKFIWDSFGDEQEMELIELKNARNSAKGFFSKNWFMFDDDNAWVIDYLGVGKFYKNALTIEDFDKLFEKTPAQIKSVIEKLTPGQKKSVEYKAREMVASGDIDSKKVITAIEESLGVNLIEK